MEESEEKLYGDSMMLGLTWEALNEITWMLLNDLVNAGDTVVQCPKISKYLVIDTVFSYTQYRAECNLHMRELRYRRYLTAPLPRR
jgi:hypothetical protein